MRLHASERLAAYASAVDAARRQIEATKKSIQAGQRMNIDLLNAEQSFYKTKVELTAEKHGHSRPSVYYQQSLSKIRIK